jgi:hypothetical protein
MLILLVGGCDQVRPWLDAALGHDAPPATGAPAPEAAASAPEEAEQTPADEVPTLPFLSMAEQGGKCLVDLAAYANGVVTVKHRVAELDLRCEGLAVEASNSGRSLGFVGYAGTAGGQAIVVREGRPSPVLLAGGVTVESLVFVADEVVALSSPDIEVQQIGEEDSPKFKVEFGGKEYVEDAYAVEPMGCASHRAPDFALADFHLVLLAEGTAPPFCRHYGHEAQKAESVELRPGDSGGFGVFYETIDADVDPETPSRVGDGQLSSGENYLLGSPTEWLEGATPTGPLTLYVQAESGWTQAVVPDSRNPSVRMPFVCGARGMILGMTGPTAATAAQVVWSADLCPLPWPEGIPLPPPWLGALPLPDPFGGDAATPTPPEIPPDLEPVPLPPAAPLPDPGTLIVPEVDPV